MSKAATTSTSTFSTVDIKLTTQRHSSTSVLPPEAQRKRDLFTKVLKEEFLAELKYLWDVANNRAVPRDTLTNKIVTQLKTAVAFIPVVGGTASQVVGAIGDVADFAATHIRDNKIGKMASLGDELDWPRLNILLDLVAREAFRRYEYFIVVLLGDDPLEGVIPFARAGARRMIEKLSCSSSQTSTSGGLSVPLNESILLCGLIEGRSGAWVDGFTNHPLKLKRHKQNLLGKLEPEALSAETVYARSGLRHYQMDVTGTGAQGIVDTCYIRKTAKHHEKSFKEKLSSFISSQNAEAYYNYGYVEFETKEPGDPKAGYALAPLEVIKDRYGFEKQESTTLPPSLRLQKEIRNFHPSVLVISSAIIRKYVSFCPPSTETGRAEISLLEYVRIKLNQSVDRLICCEDLRGIILKGANLSHTDLSGATLSGDLTGTIFDDCYLVGTEFKVVISAQGASFQRAHCEFMVAQKVNFTGADFTQADFSYGDLTGSTLMGCKTLGAIWRETQLYRVTAPEELYKEHDKQLIEFKQELVIQQQQMDAVEEKIYEHTADILALKKEIERLNVARPTTGSKSAETQKAIEHFSRQMAELTAQQQKMIENQIKERMQAWMKDYRDIRQGTTASPTESKKPAPPPPPLMSRKLPERSMPSSESKKSVSQNRYGVTAPKLENQPVDEKALRQLLQWVAEGEQDKAEELIKKDKDLLLHAGTVTDLSGREFKGITSFQYALWALDWHMWTMIQKHLPREAQAQQLQELETQGTAHGKHSSLQELTDALQTYDDKFDSWNWDQRDDHWIIVVGGAQEELPAHVVNEYCRSDRAFDPCPTEWQTKLQRTREIEVWDRQYKYVKGSWFIAPSPKDALGLSSAFLRYNYECGPKVMHRVGVAGRVSTEGGLDGCSLANRGVDLDRQALQSLWRTRTQQLDMLSSELQLSSPKQPVTPLQSTSSTDNLESTRELEMQKLKAEMEQMKLAHAQQLAEEKRRLETEKQKGIGRLQQQQKKPQAELKSRDREKIPPPQVITPISSLSQNRYSLTAPKSPIKPVDEKALSQLLQYVAEGEQDKAEALIQKDKNLLLHASMVTDLSGREFKQITAFQYALWALDWHMWTMIQKHLPKEAQAEQLRALEMKGTAHGKHFSLQELTDALQVYADNVEKVWNYDQRATDHWCKVVGGAQKKITGARGE